MKICFITTSFPRHKNDDAGIFLARLVAALSEKKVLGTVIAPHYQGAELEERFFDWKVIRTKYGIFSSGKLAYGSGIMPNLRANPFLLVQIPSLLLSFTVKAIAEARASDLIHAHWLASAIPGFIASIITRKPLVATIRGEDLKLLALPVLGPLLKLLLNKQAHITTVSDHFQKKLEFYFPKKTIYLIRNGVTRISSEDASLGTVQAKHSLIGIPYAIYAGRVIPLKRLEVIVKLMAQLKEPSLHLVVCGSLDDQDYCKNLKKEINNLILDQRIHFLGAINPDEYVQLLSGARLYFSASEYEGRPNAVLEALAQGVPPVISNIAGHSALVKDGQNGILFEPQALTEAASRVDSILESKSLHQNMSSKAIESVSELSWEGCADNYMKLYHRVIER